MRVCYSRQDYARSSEFPNTMIASMVTNPVCEVTYYYLNERFNFLEWNED